MNIVKQHFRPDDLKDLSPKDQMSAIVRRSLYMMSVGTLVVLIVSDPTVDVLSDFGNRLGIKPFVISFLLAPMASNASELVAAFSYAKKKTASTMAVALSTLEGAGIMNNTFTTAIFFIGIYINPGIEVRCSILRSNG
jgi:Ca2+/Na+ antiporter